MKKLLSLLLLLLLPMIAMAEADLSYIEEELPDAPLWTAEMRQLTRMRKVKNMRSEDWLGRVPEEAVVNVYAYLGDWCVCEYKGDIGYLPYERLWNFRKIADIPLPMAIPVEGIATMLEDYFMLVEKYPGNTLKAGDLVCCQEDGTVPMMRLSAELPEGAFAFEPFVAPEEAKPGDALYGFTTFYGESLGGRLPENRDFNIELAIERLQGVVVEPGGTFSFNQYCGPYKKSNGYMKAKNVSQDGYGYGGGVCQVSTTIFNAIQQLDYSLVEWQLHTYAGVKYAPRNMDAAVASSRDFSFVNNHDFPLEMTVMSQEGVLTVVFRRGGTAE